MRARSMSWWGLVGVSLVACEHDHGEHGHGQPVEIRFAAKVGAETFGCDKTFTGVGATPATALEPLDFRLYVHDVRLVDAEGTEWPVTLEQDRLWQAGALALLDFEDKSGTCANGTVETNRSVRGTYDTGHVAVDLVGVRFVVGVPFDDNHQDVATAESPLNLSGLYWNWNAGYKFTRLDMKVVGGTGINLHVGSMGCQLGEGTTEVASCAAPNRPAIELTGFDPASDTIVIDYAALVDGLDLADDQGGAPGCMSAADDPECVTIFGHLGLDITTGLPASGQTAFRVE
ncbi:MAG: metallo-mystery pair system four-Cys motif protein [Deltaproteobacteria bacterium]|nr:metallo-mystery pair system four-Cys motif protein [Deltaproteobacteria bacterium]